MEYDWIISDFHTEPSKPYSFCPFSRSANLSNVQWNCGVSLSRLTMMASVASARSQILA